MHTYRYILLFLFSLGLVFFTRNTAFSDENCITCHEDPELISEEEQSLFIDFKKFISSIHSQAEISCIDCHSDLINIEDFPHQKNLKSVNCGECHKKAAEEFLESIHSQGKKYSPSVTCADCHGKHDILSPQDMNSRVYATKIAAVCSRCHDDKILAHQYGFLTSRLKTYSNSFHGTASKFGETRVANCASCHGYHDIRQSSDPKSLIHIENLAKTCGKCHAGAGINFTKGKIHMASEKTSNKWAYFVKTLYIILIAGIIFILLIFIITDLAHKLSHKWKVKKIECTES